MNSFDLSDFIASTIQDSLGRTAGVGGVELFGAEYAMRIWLDPAKLVNFGLMPSDVTVAIQSQNVQLAAGELGGLPAVQGQELNATIVGPSYLSTAAEFGNILLKVTPSGGEVRLHDVARVELRALVVLAGRAVQRPPRLSHRGQSGGRGERALDRDGGAQDHGGARIELSARRPGHLPL